MRNIIITAVLATSTAAHAEAVVDHGRFTNIYVFPNPSRETWEQHMRRLRPTDADRFSRASIDHFTEELMTGWPGYFDALVQWGVYPPRFFGSAVASQSCVDAALRDAAKTGGVMQVNTVRSLANCHIDGRDPSPQVNLIFSPDIMLASASLGSHLGTESLPDMCATNVAAGYHSGGINVPNFAALPTSPRCSSDFDAFTRVVSHEEAEMLTDPGGFGVGNLGKDEVGDRCETDGANNPTHSADVAFTTYKGFAVARYWSNFDQDCEPRMDPPAGSTSELIVLGIGAPLARLTGDRHAVALDVPTTAATTDAAATQVKLFVQTGGDDLRGGNDNVDAELVLRGGSRLSANINRGASWGNNSTHAAVLAVPPGTKVSDITGVILRTHFTGGCCGDNWNVDKVALQVSFAAGSVVRRPPPPPVVQTWIDRSAAPLIRFTGDVHDLALPIAIADAKREVIALNLVIGTGNDDLRGGNDNVDVFVDLKNGTTIAIRNANQGQKLDNWTDRTITIPLPSATPLHGGDVVRVRLHTAFGGGCCGDNWNVNRVQLLATLR